MQLNGKYTWMWAIWILAFGAIEWSAIKDRDTGDTLSEHIWKLVGTKTQDRNWYHWIWRLGLLALFAWLIPHFFTGWSWFRSKL